MAVWQYEGNVDGRSAVVSARDSDSASPGIESHSNHFAIRTLFLDRDSSQTGVRSFKLTTRSLENQRPIEAESTAHRGTNLRPTAAYTHYGPTRQKWKARSGIIL